MDLQQWHQEAKKRLHKIGQEHLLRFWDELNDIQKTDLLCQIDRLELERIPEWVDNYVHGEGTIEIPQDFEPAPYYPAQPPLERKEEYERAHIAGEKLLREGKVAGFVVAGGQGTRLGFDGPKGNFPISPIKKKTLFQIFAEGLLAARNRFQAEIPWYIMTSPLNNEETIELFEKNEYYGLPREDVLIFQQGTNPNFAFDGRIFLSGKHTIAKSPDGHGGSLKALYTSGAVSDMRDRGIEQISYWQVDNPLIHVMDPLFIGLHAQAESGMSSKTLKKSGPLEKVGNFCMVDGRITVIEYSDLPDEQAYRKKPDGSLVFELGSIAIHMISVAFVEKLNRHGFALPIHKAVKKIPYLDEEGNVIEPDKPSGVKLETFVFDALPMSKKSIILETIRSQEFAPVKNATGTDSAEVTHHMMIDRAADWLQRAGITVPRTKDGKPDCVIEIAPSFALYPDDVKSKIDQVPPILPGNWVYLA
ncbi:MAG: UDPGP type 1 family protein [Sedimentisphaerales bacterium]|nr:UDPGP type 1 family protein [Sedimentisphaerales bacterium]